MNVRIAQKRSCFFCKKNIYALCEKIFIYKFDTTFETTYNIK